MVVESTVVRLIYLDVKRSPRSSIFNGYRKITSKERMNLLNKVKSFQIYQDILLWKIDLFPWNTLFSKALIFSVLRILIVYQKQQDNSKFERLTSSCSSMNKMLSIMFAFALFIYFFPIRQNNITYFGSWHNWCIVIFIHTVCFFSAYIFRLKHLSVAASVIVFFSVFHSILFVLLIKYVDHRVWQISIDNQRIYW